MATLVRVNPEYQPKGSYVVKTGDTMSGTLTLPAAELMPGSTSAGHGGYIDFHYNGSTSDYTSRIIENGSGNLNIPRGLTVGGNKVATMLENLRTLPRVHHNSLPSASTSNTTYFKEWIAYYATHSTYKSRFLSGDTLISIGHPNSLGVVIGAAYENTPLDSSNMPQYSYFMYIPLGDSNNIYKFGTNNYNFYWFKAFNSDTGIVYSNSKSSVKMGTGDTLGTGLSVPSGTYVVTATVSFAAAGSSGARNLVVGIKNGSTTLNWNRFYYNTNSGHRLTTTWTGTLSAASTLYAYGSTSVAESTSSSSIMISAVRIV